MKVYCASFVISCLAITIASPIVKIAEANRTFEIDYVNDQFLKDGVPFRYVSGSLHYFRVPRAYWQDRLKKFRAAGLNVVSTYIEWSLHEPKPGEYDFSGENDFEYFTRLAGEEGLLVILRPGPYICAERDFGGYPPWLLHENPNMSLRTSDPSHKKYVYNWLTVLMPRIQPLLYGNGGPVIMVQLENEYGSYVTCDRSYTLWLRSLFQQYVDNKAVLFTTDGYASSFLKCGPIPGVFATVDFGAEYNVTEAFAPLRKVQLRGPLVNSEFYPGWLTHWGEPVNTVSTEYITKTTHDMLAINASFNFYVFFGGTNFGFTAGANNPSFAPQLTSYDYDAPITEAGDLTNKYFEIKSVISKFMQVEDKPVKNLTKANYGMLKLDAKVALFDSDTGTAYGEFKYPQAFESLELYSGLMLYETILPQNYSKPGFLTTSEIHDRAIVYLDKKPAGLLSRSDSNYAMIISGNAGQSLGLLVENQGHINYGSMLDLKGLVKNLTLNGETLINWKHTGFPLKNVSHVADLPSVNENEVKLPAFYAGTFQLPSDMATPLDTFVNMSGWTKGVLYVNGHNLGRYWPQKGPQVTLYLPGPFLLKYPQRNSVIVLELERVHSTREISFLAAPLWANQ